MGHGADDESAACRVLPVIGEETDESEEGMTKQIAERRKAAIVSRMRELLRRAAAAQSAHTKQIAERRKAAIVSRMRELLRRAAAAQSAHTKLRRSTAKKWKRVVGRIQSRGGHHRVVQDEGMSSSASSISSSKSSSSCSSNKLVSSPATSFIRLSCTSPRMSSGSDYDMRMAHWVTTDTDFVVLEL